MRLFVLIYFGIYGAINAYALWKIGRGFGRLGWWWLVPCVFGVAMILAPMVAHRLADRQAMSAARAVALIAYSWMAIAMWLVCLGILTDVWNYVIRSLAYFRPGVTAVIVSPRTVLVGCVAVVAILTTWGLVSGARLGIRTIHLNVPGLGAPGMSVRVVHISDLHLGLTNRAAMLDQILDRVEEARPDILVCTGDVWDSAGPQIEQLAARFSAVHAPLGKFAVTGNHEFYAGIQPSVAGLERSGFNVLREASVDVGDRLRICGVDDPAGLQMGVPCYADDTKALPTRDAGRFTVLLKHRPVASPEAEGRFDLQLSGHTHGGQVFPFQLALRLLYPMSAGPHRLHNGSLVYVSRGSGNWGPPFRVLAPREVTVFVLESE